MAVPLRVGGGQQAATVVVAAVAKVELIDEAVAWRQLAPYSRVLQEQVDRLLQQRESIVSTLEALRRSLGEPVTTGAHLAAVPSPRHEAVPDVTRWWAAA